MRKVFRTEDLLVAFIASIGYGAGYVVAKSRNHSEIVCLLISIIAGLILDALGGKMIKTKWAKKSMVNKVLMTIATVLVFLIIAYLFDVLFDYSLWEELREEILWGTVGATVAGFFITVFIQPIKAKNIRLRYKDGSQGHKMSEDELSYIEGLKGVNREIKGEYDRSLAVKTENGIFLCREEGEVQEFLGIPYARPPVGRLRWKAPQKPEVSDRVWAAHYFGNSAMQVDNETISLRTHAQSEDCLTLNVWRTSNTEESSGLKPVLVLVHGGNLGYGGSAEPLYDGINFVKTYPDVIFVSFNYRLGIFGFVNITGIPGAEEYEDGPNLGLQDQIMALEWIHTNILSFGGDPDHVMLVGDTMGGSCVKILSTLKETNRLFQKALVISGNTIMDEKQNRSMIRFADIARDLGAKTMEDMLKVPAEKLKQYVEERNDQFLFMPSQSNRPIQKDTDQAIRNGDSGEIRFIYGIPAGELSAWITVSNEKTMYDWINITLNDLLADSEHAQDKRRLEEVLAHYRKEEFLEKEAEKKTLEFWFYRYSSLKNCIDLSNRGKTVRCFFWDVKSPVIRYSGNSLSAVGALLGNTISVEDLGHLIDDGVQNVFQQLIYNELAEDVHGLAYDEVKGVDQVEWDAFSEGHPAALHFTNENVKQDEAVLAKDAERIKKWVRTL